MTKSLEIDWGNIYDYFSIENSDDPRLLQKGSLYMILTGVYNEKTKKYTNIKLHYIGQTKDQTPKVRILQPHSAYTKLNKFLKIYPGRVILCQVGLLNPISQNTVTPTLLDEAENAVVFDFYNNNTRIDCECAFNDKLKDSYTGSSLTILNKGDYSPLNETIVTDTF